MICVYEIETYIVVTNNNYGPSFADPLAKQGISKVFPLDALIMQFLFSLVLGIGYKAIVPCCPFSSSANVNFSFNIFYPSIMVITMNNNWIKCSYC